MSKPGSVLPHRFKAFYNWIGGYFALKWCGKSDHLSCRNVAATLKRVIGGLARS